MTCQAFAQIEVPAETKRDTPIPVTLKAMVPEGATIQSGSRLVWPDGVNKLEVGPGKWVVCAAPGEYTITYQVRWIHIVPITFKDFDGKEVTFQNYLGSGDIDEKATFKVVGGTPIDPPLPPPVVGGPYQIFLLYDAETKDNLSKQQLAVLGSLTFRMRLEKAGHRVLGVSAAQSLTDPTASKHAAYFEAAKNVPLPCLVVSSMQGGKCVAMPLPVDEDATEKLLTTELLK